MRSPLRQPETADHGVHAPVRLRAAPPRRPPGPARASSPSRPVERPRLVAALVDGSRPLAVLVAPAGYGKSTVLAEWRARDPRPFAYVGLSAAHDDPAQLLAAVDAALAELPRPSVLALDDVHVLRSEAARAAVTRLATAVPAGSTVALASRGDPPLPLGRLRAQDAVVELRASHLAMTRAEAEDLLRRTGLTLTERQVERLFELTAGWPAALTLAARAIRDQGGTAAALEAFRGDDGIVGEYVREELLAALGSEDRAFLRRTSVIGRLGGPVCDAALGDCGSGAALRRIAHANVPLLALDRTELEYRHHPLFAQALRAELRRTEPELEAGLHLRLSRFYEHDGDPGLAIEHAVAGRDRGLVSRLLAEHSAPLVAAGRAGLVAEWLRRIGDDVVAADAQLAITAAAVRLARGERDAAERWAAIALEAAPPGGDGDAEAVGLAAALVRAASAREGIEQMTRDAQRVRAGTPARGPWRSVACLIEGSGLLLSGHAEAARTLLHEGAQGAIFDAPLVRSLCLAELAFQALDEGDAGHAAALATRARAAIERGRSGEDPLAALTYAVSALARVHRGRLDAAREDLTLACRRLAEQPDELPWYGALVRVALARVQLKLSDAREGRRLLDEAARLRRQTDGAVALQAWIDEGWALADDYAAGPVACPTTLTLAELRVLRLLPSHLTLREIAARLHVSPNTVKTQAHAVYRKLDASSRSQAVEHAAAVGLVEP